MRVAQIRLSLLAALTGLVLAGNADASIELVLNGGFEEPTTPFGSYNRYYPGDEIGPGWRVTNRSGGFDVDGSDMLLINNNYSENYQGPIAFTANSGQNALDITGAGNTGPNNGVIQQIATVIGQKYVLSFFVGRADDSPAPGNYLTPSSIGVSVSGDSPITDFVATNTNSTNATVNWKKFAITFIADSAFTDIAFTNATVGNNYAGLDDVSVMATPEPSTLVLGSIGGMVGVGCALRRRKRALSTGV